MKNFIKYILISIIAITSTGCSAYVRYPSVGVRVKSQVRTEARVVCHWEYIKPNVRIKRCKKVRVKIRY